MVYAWKIGSDATPLRKLEGIDTTFLSGTVRPCIAAGGGKLFLASEVELRGYNW